MEFVAFILFLCLVCTITLLAVNLFASDNDEIPVVFTAGMLLLIVAFGYAMCESVKTLKSPTALDVYQGKTTLEVTYKDSVPVDSVVVFK